MLSNALQNRSPSAVKSVLFFASILICLICSSFDSISSDIVLLRLSNSASSMRPARRISSSLSLRFLMTSISIWSSLISPLLSAILEASLQHSFTRSVIFALFSSIVFTTSIMTKLSSSVYKVGLLHALLPCLTYIKHCHTSRSAKDPSFLLLRNTVRQ